jgi:hypothetical protein
MSEALNDDFHDGLFRTKVKFQPHEGKLYAEKTQLNESAILAGNAIKRAMDQTPLEWGRQIASIPQIMYDKWCREHPELLSKDKQIRSMKLLALIREHPEVMVVDRAKV